MTQNGRVLVIGGTRGTGRLAVELLLRVGFSVRVLARDPVKAREAFGDRVEVVQGDVTRAETLHPAVRGADHVVLTAAVTTRPAPERLVRATVFDGTVNVLEAARAVAFRGRLVYMSALGTTRRSALGFLLNLAKGNTLEWRRRAEEEIRRSGMDYTIVHAGILNDEPAGRRAIRVTQQRLPLSPRYRISRGDVAGILVHALREPRAERATIDVAWGRGEPIRDASILFREVVPDPANA